MLRTGRGLKVLTNGAGNVYSINLSFVNSNNGGWASCINWHLIWVKWTYAKELFSSLSWGQSSLIPLSQVPHSAGEVVQNLSLTVRVDGWTCWSFFVCWQFRTPAWYSHLIASWQILSQIGSTWAPTFSIYTTAVCLYIVPLSIILALWVGLGFATTA